MVQVEGEQVCLANVAGRFYAIGNLCTHVGGPLAQGFLTDHAVTCPWHGSQFDLATGEVKRGPASQHVSGYEVKIEGTNVLVQKRPSIPTLSGPLPR